MAEYIDKDYVTKCLMESWAHCGIPSDAKNKMLKWLNKAPTAADVMPVRRGRWLPIVDGNEYGDAFQVGCYCSECGEGMQCEPKYCPACGAKMDKEEANG